MPKPRKLSDATVKIAYPSRTVVSTRIGGSTFGRISTNMMCSAPSPRNSAAAT